MERVFLFTQNGLGDGPADLQQALVIKFLALLLESDKLPRRLLFYTEGVRLACSGSPVLEHLQRLERSGVELVLCKTCLERFGLLDQVQVGVVGGMGDILQTMLDAAQVISV